MKAAATVIYDLILKHVKTIAAKETAKVEMISQCHFCEGGIDGHPSCRTKAATEATLIEMIGRVARIELLDRNHVPKSIMPVAMPSGIPIKLKISPMFIFVRLLEQQ